MISNNVGKSFKAVFSAALNDLHKFKNSSMTVEEVLRTNQYTIVDVRGPSEFINGNIESALNVPLQEVSERLEELRLLPSPMVLCCVSGIRSGKAAKLLSKHGVTCVNGGSWKKVNRMISTVE